MREGWEVKKLGQVSNVQRGLTYGRNDTVDISENIVLRATNIKLESNSLDFNDLKYLTDDFEIKDIYKLKVGSLLICFSSGSKNHLGKVAIVEEPYAAAFGGFIGQITPNEIVIPRYLFYNLISDNYRKYISELTDGMNINNLKSGDLKQFPIPIPPLQEQKQIVALLDKAFTAIDQAKANIEKNIVNAKELFDSSLESLYEGVVKYEDTSTLNDICELIVDCEHKTAPTQDIGHPSIRTPNIGKGELILEKVRRVSEETYNLWTRRAIPESGDLIMAREAPAGNVAIIPDNEQVCLGQRTLLIRPKKDRISPLFLTYYLLTSSVQKLLLSNSTGATVQHVNMKDIRNLKIGKFPSLSIQREIENKLQSLKDKTYNLGDIYKKRKMNLEELKKSILQKAFSGELIQKEVEV
jgi:type I restriction enzyme S subunit